MRLPPPVSITPACGPLFAPYYQAFASQRQWSRHYMSLMCLGQFPHHFGYSIIGDCLVLMKRRLFGANKIVYAAAPPMHVKGDLKSEREMVEYLLSLGMPVRMLHEDIPLLGIPNPTYTCEPEGNEFIYGARKMREGVGDHMRYAINQARRMEKEGKAVLRTVTRLTQDDQKACVEVSRAWKTTRGLAAPNSDYALRKFNEFADTCPGNFALTLIEEEYQGRPLLVAFSVTEKIAPLWGCVPSRKTRFGWQGHVKKLTKAVHALDGAYWDSTVGPDFQLNRGSGSRSDSLAEAKRQMKPIHESPLLTLRPTVAQHPELWEASKIGTPEEVAQDTVLDLFL